MKACLPRGNETAWDDQFAREGLAPRARAVNNLPATLMADYGMTSNAALRSATPVAGKLPRLEIGQVKARMLARSRT